MFMNKSICNRNVKHCISIFTCCLSSVGLIEVNIVGKYVTVLYYLVYYIVLFYTRFYQYYVSILYNLCPKRIVKIVVYKKKTLHHMLPNKIYKIVI